MLMSNGTNPESLIFRMISRIDVMVNNFMSREFIEGLGAAGS